MIGQTISHYRIIEKLGEGGMGVVYKAHDTHLDRPVALKFLPPHLTSNAEAKERFMHEAKAASALQHTNICVIHDFDNTPEGQLFIAMEYLQGKTLKEKLEDGPLGTEEAVGIALQVARGLTRAHEHGIVHRDIKPANIIVTSEGLAKIVDFGLAKLSGQTMVTQAGSTLGTVAYMSPEQARGGTADTYADIWSLGVVLFEMLTGQLPFRGAHEAAMMYSIINEDPVSIRTLKPGIPRLLIRLFRNVSIRMPQRASARWRNWPTRLKYQERTLRLRTPLQWFGEKGSRSRTPGSLWRSFS